MVKKRTLVLLTFIILLAALMIQVSALAAGKAAQPGKAVQPKQIDITNSPFKGPKDAPIVMIAFDDFQ